MGEGEGEADGGGEEAAAWSSSSNGEVALEASPPSFRAALNDASVGKSVGKGVVTPLNSLPERV